MIERVDFELAGDKYTESLHYDSGYGFQIDLTRDAITTGKLATVSQMESAISGKADLSAVELKQDKLSEAQLSAIDHAVQNNGGVAKIESIALSAYEGLVTPDPTTLYVIPEESGNA